MKKQTHRKMVSIGDFLTKEEMDKAVEIFRTDGRNFHRRCMKEILEPNMARIDAALEQKNDAGFLAYMIEYVLSQAR